MKTYLRNINSAIQIHRDGRWVGSMSIYKFLYRYTLKYISTWKQK